jgi:predicted short-subunit dehydrogenase-like oxidoreductase (DUF2520 family)
MPLDSEVRVGFIGVGTLGRGLALAMHGVGCKVTGAASRRRESAEWLADRIEGCRALESAQAVADACDLVFITTPDGAITEVAASVRWRGGQGVAHCCGAASLELLSAASESGASVGAMHPFQTFAGLAEPADAANRLTGVTFAITATGWLGTYLPALANKLGGRAISVPDEMRPLYHASAVLGCGYVATLLDAAISIWPALGLNTEDGTNAVEPLVRATIEAIANVGLTRAVTGPAVRGDTATVQAHIEALLHHAPQLAPLYRELTLASVPLARSKGVDDATLARLSDAVAGSAPA